MTKIILIFIVKQKGRYGLHNDLSELIKKETLLNVCTHFHFCDFIDPEFEFVEYKVHGRSNYQRQERGECESKNNGP